MGQRFAVRIRNRQRIHHKRPIRNMHVYIRIAKKEIYIQFILHSAAAKEQKSLNRDTLI